MHKTCGMLFGLCGFVIDEFPTMIFWMSLCQAPKRRHDLPDFDHDNERWHLTYSALPLFAFVCDASGPYGRWEEQCLEEIRQKSSLTGSLVE